MRYAMGFAGALLLAMSSSLFAVDAIRDAGSKVRGEWLGSAQPVANSNQAVIYRSYSVAPRAVAIAPVPRAVVNTPAPSVPAPKVAAAPAAPSNNAVRRYSYQPTQANAYSNRPAARMAPYLRADHKILGQYGG